MITRGRMLHVLDVNDQPADTLRSGADIGTHFVVSSISSWAEAQVILAGERELPRPDILLLDVSFDRDAGVSGASVGRVTRAETFDAIVPVGPTIALCFLNQRLVMGFAPYSAHIKNPTLLKYPPFLVTIGLIAARSEGKVYSSQYLAEGGRSDRSLDSYLTDMASIGDPGHGLEVALRQYRCNLQRAIKSKHVTALNMVSLIMTLEQASAPAGVSRMPPDASLQLAGDGLADEVSVLSLFADRLNWISDLIDDAVRLEIITWLQECGAPDPALTTAFDLIRGQDNVQEATDNRPRVDEILQHNFGYLSRDDKREVLRLCVLFANVHAWLVEPPGADGRVSRTVVLNRLGIKDINTYRSWFGARFNDPSIEVCGNTIRIAPLPQFEINVEHEVTGKNARLFLSPNSLLSEDDDQRVRRYRSAFGSAEGYPESKLPYQVCRDGDEIG